MYKIYLYINGSKIYNVTQEINKIGTTPGIVFIKCNLLYVILYD